MSQLKSALAEVRKRIVRAQKGLNEASTKTTLIEPVLRALGWDPEDVETVQHEFRVRPRDNPVDYALLVMREAKLFVEAKALGRELEDHKLFKQIMSYAGVAGVEWIVLTDGNEYRIYNAHASVPIDQKLLMSVRLSDSTPMAEQLLSVLARDQLQTKRIEALWRSNFVDRKVQTALEKFFDPEGMVLLNHIRNGAKDLTTDEVRGSLRRCRARFEYPPDIIPVPPAPRGKTKVGPPDIGPQPLLKDAGLLDLIQAGLIRAPLELRRKYLGVELRAHVQRDGRVEYAGEFFDSLSSAGSAARAAVGGVREDGKRRATNGWTFWRYELAEGREEEINEVRQRLLKQDKAKPGKSATGA